MYPFPAELLPSRIDLSVGAQFIPIIDAILYASDLSTVSVKSVRTGLQSQLGYDITAQKASPFRVLNR